MGQACGRGARRPRGGMARLLRPGETRAMSLHRFLAHLKREISEKKRVEARQWTGGRTSKEKYRMPSRKKPDGTVAGSSKRLASRFYH